MKCKLLVPSIAVVCLMSLAIGCGRKETPFSTPSADMKTTDPAAVSAASATDAQKAADAKKSAEDMQAADAQKLRDATASRQAEAEKMDKSLKQGAADNMTTDQTAAEKQTRLAAGAGKVQALIGSAKALSGENKWADVLKVLAQLAVEKLTPDQQTAVDGLKADAQKHAAASVVTKAHSNAGNSLGGILEPKK